MTRTELIEVSNGVTEVLVDHAQRPSAVALIAHPHPLLGGNANHKVPFTMMRAAHSLGVSTYRPNFRGVGKSSGEHDGGDMETQDIMDLIRHIREREIEVPFILMGFSFGAYIAARVEHSLGAGSRFSDDVILCGLPNGEVPGNRFYPTPSIAGAFLIHGERDESAPLAQALRWAEPSHTPITVIPGADHFFSGRLDVLASLVSDRVRSKIQPNPL